MANAQKQNVVIGGAAQVKVGRELVTLYKGAVLPSAVDAEQVKHLIAVGIVEKKTVRLAKDDDALGDGTSGSGVTDNGQETVVEVPDGDPSEKWTEVQLRAYAAADNIEIADDVKGKQAVWQLVSAANTAS
jgi:hypothetical protein